MAAQGELGDHRLDCSSCSFRPSNGGGDIAVVTEKLGQKGSRKRRAGKEGCTKRLVCARLNNGSSRNVHR